MNTKKNLPMPLTKVLQNDDGHHCEINIAFLNPAVHDVFINTVFSPVFINQRQYIYASDAERDEFDKYWNTTGRKELEAGPHDGCRGILTGIAIMVFILALILVGLNSCAPKQYAPVKSHNPHLRVNKSVDDPARSYNNIKQ
jgi:hypothetical protein